MPPMRSMAVRAMRAGLNIIGKESVAKPIHGIWVRLPIDRYPIRELLRRGSIRHYEREFFSAALARLRPGDCVFDVGAHKGLFGMCAHRVIGELGRIFCFEPNPESFKTLTRTVAVNRASSIQCVQRAVARTPGRAKFYLTGSGSTLISDHEDAKHIDIDVSTLDEQISQLGHAPDVLKIDVEGAELSTLMGGSRTLSSCRAVLCEIHPQKLTTFGHHERDVHELLVQHDFEKVWEHRPAKHLDDPGRPYHAIYEKRDPVQQRTVATVPSEESALAD